jgi:hypothetical protein
MRARHTLSLHHPRKRMIQYSAASVIEAKVRGVLDTRFRGYDGLLRSNARAHRGTTAAIFALSHSLARRPITAYLYPSTRRTPR